jgi:predicted tellurium resistance membrane protein TerC
MIDLLTDPQAWAAFVTLSALEIGLGIDNVVFISILVARVDAARARSVRQFGLGLALIMRILMLLGLTWLIGLTEPVAVLIGKAFSWHDIILIAGGLFLIAKATHEIHTEIEPGEPEAPTTVAAAKRAFGMIVGQIVIEDRV